MSKKTYKELIAEIQDWLDLEPSSEWGQFERDLSKLITAHEPAKPEPVAEWVTEEEWWLYSMPRTDGTRANAPTRIALNSLLMDKFGDPTVQVYHGEKPEGFGMKDNSPVLWWIKFSHRWTDLPFAALSKGDIWRKQPPAPEVSNG